MESCDQMEKTSKGEEYASLTVPNVQDLATKELKDIPSRYIRPEAEIDSVLIHESLKVPVIDLQKLLDEQMGGDEMASLHKACKDWGFFQLINHGVPEEIIESLKGDTEVFFKLPLEEKRAYAQQPDSFHGYGQAFVVSEEQKLDWSDIFVLRTLPVSERIMRFWPENPYSFRETIDKYAVELEKLTVCLLGLIAKNLGVEPEKLISIYKGGIQWLRMNYYPPCPQAEKVLGISPHSDASLITLLIQVNEVEGLQIKKNGNWVPVKAIPGAFIVNFGDAIEILSNGIYKSIEHRGIIHPEKERISIASFQDPKSGVIIGPFSELFGDNNGANYKTVNYDHYLRQFFSTKLDGKRVLDLIKL